MKDTVALCWQWQISLSKHEEKRKVDETPRKLVGDYELLPLRTEVREKQGWGVKERQL